MSLQQARQGLVFRTTAFIQAAVFIFSTFALPFKACAQSVMELPAPGAMVSLSDAYVPVMLRAVKIHPDQPLVFDFIVDSGNTKASQAEIRKESEKLAKYFLASLTIPEKDLWVNLSPFEQDRIVPESFGQTQMGRDLLAQDYVLKQISASLIYPEKELGKEFWSRVYAQAREKLGTNEIPAGTFNKVWIMPDQAEVYELNNTAILGKSHLKVMMDEDYVALKASADDERFSHTVGQNVNAANKLSSQVMRQIVLPEIEKEVNTGKNFALLRQVYQALILATWYKNNLKESLLAQVYSDQNKIAGVDAADKADKEKIYARYIEAYKQGVFNYIKEETDPQTQETLPRKYFSGGNDYTNIDEIVDKGQHNVHNAADIPGDALEGTGALAQVTVAAVRSLTPDERKGFIARSNLPHAIIEAFHAGRVGQEPDEEGALLFAVQHGLEYLFNDWPETDTGAQKQRLQQVQDMIKFVQVNDDRIGRLTRAADTNDVEGMNKVYEEARTDLPGPKESRPAFFWVHADRPVTPVNVAAMSVAEIRQAVGKYLEITEEEAAKLKDKTPFSFETFSRMERNDKVFQAALKSGVLGVQYFMTNIKRTSENSHVGYIEFMKELAEKYNGYVQIFLSVEESTKVLKGDNCGMVSAFQAVRNVMGEEFFRKATFNIITDGGTKDRGGNPTGKNSYNGDFPTSYGVRYYERAIETIFRTRGQHQRFGAGRIVWTASDGDYDIGDMKVGSLKESELQNDGTWGMIIHGAEEQIFKPEDQLRIFEILEKNLKDYQEQQKIATEDEALESLLDDEQREQAFEAGLRREADFVAAALDHIREKKLEQLGENFADPQTGRMKLFVEKPTPVKMLYMLKKLNTNRIIPNAYLAVFTVDAFLQHQEGYEKATIDGEPLRIHGGSYFQNIIQAQFDPKVWGKLPLDAQEGYKGVVASVSVKDGKILAGSLGNEGRFDDRGKTEFLRNDYREQVAKQTAPVTKKGNVVIEQGIELNVPAGSKVVLENVRIENPDGKPVKLTLKGLSYIQNSRIVVPQDLEVEGLIIEESDIMVPLRVTSGVKDVVLQGVIVRPDLEVSDITATGTWENIAPKGLELFSGETVVSILTTKGLRYINRTFTAAEYKGKSLQDLIAGEFAEMSVSNPRLVGVKGISDATFASVELIKMENWRDNDGKNVAIDDAKKDADYLRMRRERNALIESVSAGADASQDWKKGGIDFNPSSLNLKVERTGRGIKVQVDPAEIQRIKTEGVAGFTPVIINIVPVKSMLPTLGLAPAEASGSAT